MLYHGMLTLSSNFYINASEGVSANQHSLPEGRNIIANHHSLQSRVNCSRRRSDCCHLRSPGVLYLNNIMLYNIILYRYLYNIIYNIMAKSCVRLHMIIMN